MKEDLLMVVTIIKVLCIIGHGVFFVVKLGQARKTTADD